MRSAIECGKALENWSKEDVSDVETGSALLDADYKTRHFFEAVESISGQLSRLSEEVTRHAVDAVQDGFEDMRTAAKVAERVQHSVLWGLANLKLDNLTDLAVKCDAAQGKAASALELTSQA